MINDYFVPHLLIPVPWNAF